MKFSITRDLLRQAIGFSNLALSATDRDVITSGVMFDVKATGVSSLLSTDKSMFSKQDISLTNVEGDFKVVVSGKKISDICQEFPDGDITFTYLHADGVLEVTGASGLISLTAYSADEYPDFSEYFDSDVLGEGVDYTEDVLERSLNFVAAFVKDDERRPDLALAELRNGKFLSSDGNKFAMFICPVLLGGIKIPYYTLASLTKAISLLVTPENTHIKIHETTNHFILNCEDKFFGYIKTDRSFPMVENKILSANPNFEVKLDREFVTQAIKRLKIALDDDNGFMNFKIAVTGTNGTMKCAVFNSRGAESHETVPLVVTSGTGEVEFAVSYDDLFKTLVLFSSASLVWKVVTGKFVEISDTVDNYTATALLPMKI